MALPILTSAEDVNAVVGYLCNKPTGATLAEMKAAVGGPTVDGRKMSAYQASRLISKDGDRVKLTPRGWELARKAKPDATIFREVLDSMPACRSALEWAFHQKWIPRPTSTSQHIGMNTIPKQSARITTTLSRTKQFAFFVF